MRARQLLKEQRVLLLERRLAEARNREREKRKEDECETYHGCSSRAKI
jgi:hypothetical protein